MVKLIKLIACFVLLSVASSVYAVPVTYVDQFPSADSTVVGSVGFINPDEVGYFWSVSRGDSVTESFTGSGLATASHLDLSLDITQNFLSQTVFWDVYIDSTLVGSWSWGAADGTGSLLLSLDFADITLGDTFDLAMYVTNEVAGGAGSIALGVGTGFALSGQATVAAPETATLLMLGLGLVGIGFLRKSKKS